MNGLECFTNVLFLCFGMLVLKTSLFVAKADVILSPSPALAAEGESFTWTCTYTGTETVSGFLWSMNGNTLAIIKSSTCSPHTVPGPPDSSLYEYACLSTSQAIFTVKQILNANNGNNWQCAVVAPGYIFSYNVTVTVQVSVSSVSLKPPTGTIREKVETIFTCETSTSRPAANITWYKESRIGQKQVITSEVSSTTESVGDLEKSTSVLEYTPSRSDNTYKIYCQALNIPGRTPVMSTKFQMDVQYSPESTPYIQNYANGSTYKVIENKQGILSCIIKGGNPLATVTWTCFNNGLSTEISGSTVTKTVTWSAIRGPDRSCTCQSSHPVAGTQSVSVNVQVLYKPDRAAFKVKGTTVSGAINFIDGKSSSVVCESNGKPYPDSYSWNKAGSSTTAGYTLTFNPVQKQDDGQYTCTAQNTMIPSSGDTEIGSSSSIVKVNVLYSPKTTPLNNKDIVAGSNVSVQCLVTKGNPESTTFKWTRNGDSRSWNTQTLYIQNVAKNDDMMYTCTVQNTMRPTGSSQETGTDSGSFHLNVLYMAQINSFTIQQQLQESATVNETDKVEFKCTVSSNPSAVIEIRFEDKILHRQENIKNLSYTRKNVACLDAGKYTCAARNKYNNGQDSMRHVQLNVRCSPRPLRQMTYNYTSLLHNSIILSFTTLAYPVPGSKGFIWHKQYNLIWIPLLSNIDLSISSSDLQTNLTIKNVSQSDYGNYRVTVTNELGNYEQYLFLTEKAQQTIQDTNKTQETNKQQADNNVLLVGVILGVICAALVLYAIILTVVLKRNFKLRELQFKPIDKSAKQTTYVNQTFNNHDPSQVNAENTQFDFTAVNDNGGNTVDDYTDLTPFSNENERTYDVINKP